MTSRAAYLASFEAYRRALEAEGFAVSDVRTDERGLLTWGAGDAESPAEVARLDEIHEQHFKTAEREYVREVFDRIYGTDRHGSV